MARTRKGERLSLRDMLVRWCAPTLVAAVRTAEAKFTDDQIRAACPCSLGGAAPAVRNQNELNPKTLDWVQQCLRVPWNDLVADLRSRIMASRIELTGVPAGSGEGTKPQRIPPSYVEAYAFDFVSNAVLWHQGGWGAVTASLNTEAADLEHEPDRPLPLRTAMLSLCDEALVDRYETAKMATDIVRAVRQGSLPSDRRRLCARNSETERGILEYPWMAQLAPARAELLADFRTRIATGEVELVGLQTAPVLAAEPARLSPAWAMRMQFDWRQQTVSVERALFVDVVGTVKQRTATPRTSNQPPKRGRPSFPMDELVAIACTRLGTRAASRKGEADALLAEFQRRHPSTKPPTVRTIEDHVARIYATAIRTTGTLRA